MNRRRAFALANRHWPAGLVAAVLIFSPLSASAQSNWRTYANLRFGFAVDYPAENFSGFEESDNSDGATFQPKDSNVELRAYGFWNDGTKSPRAYVSEAYGSRPLAYAVIKRDFFIASGTAGDAIFYDRCNFSRDRVICIKVVYPAARKQQWDKIVPRVSRSLRRIAVHRGAIERK